VQEPPLEPDDAPDAELPEDEVPELEELECGAGAGHWIAGGTLQPS
jgi:hypothetical protein